MLGEALTSILRSLEHAQRERRLQHYALIGGLAVSAWGVPRATRDIDIALALGTQDARAFSKSIGASLSAGDPDDPLSGVLKIDVAVRGDSVPVQLLLLPRAWEELVFSHIVTLDVLGVRVPVVSWDALVLLKLYAGGPYDVLDAQHVLTIQRPSPAQMSSLRTHAHRLGLEKSLQDLLARTSGLSDTSQ